MLKGNLAGNARTDTKGVSARVYRNGVYGFASAADMNDAAVKAVLDNATSNAAFLDKHAGQARGALPTIARGTLPTQPDMADLPQKVYIDYLKALDDYIQQKYPDLASRTVVSSSDSMEKIICTSDGCTAHIIAPRSYIYIILNSQTKDGVPVELFKAVGGRGTFDAHFTDPALVYPTIDTLYERLMHKREGVYASAGVKTCILGGELAARARGRGAYGGGRPGAGRLGGRAYAQQARGQRPGVHDGLCAHRLWRNRAPARVCGR